MLDEIQALAHWFQALPPVGVYALVLVVAFLENVVPPVPGDALIVLAGSLVAAGVVGFAPVVALSVVGSVLGFGAMFWIGSRLGDAVDDPVRMRWLPRGPVYAVEGWLSRWGYGVVALNRFLSGGRAVIALMAGATGLRAVPTLLWATVSAVIWTTLLVAGGRVLGDQWPLVLDLLHVYGRVVMALLAALVVGAVAHRAWRRRREGRKETAKTPEGESPGGTVR